MGRGRRRKSGFCSEGAGAIGDSEQRPASVFPRSLWPLGFGVEGMRAEAGRPGLLERCREMRWCGPGRRW